MRGYKNEEKITWVISSLTVSECMVLISQVHSDVDFTFSYWVNKIKLEKIWTWVVFPLNGSYTKNQTYPVHQWLLKSLWAV